MLRDTFLTLSHSEILRNLATDLPPARRVSRRFVAGETLDDAIAAVRTANDEGLVATLDFLGENVTTRAEAQAYCTEYVRALDRIHHEEVVSNVSLKLSGLGFDVSPDLAIDNLRQVLITARSHRNFVRIDMESSAYLLDTLAIYGQLRDEGFDNVGVVIQSYLYRSADDVKALIKRGANVRLVKGAYDEPAKLAFPRKADVDANFIHLMKLLLGPEARAHGVRLAVATHDDNMIQATNEYAAQQGLTRADYEFQMLYGIRSSRQVELARAGHPVRVYIPYGTHWYPYFMRRLAERPANLFFVLKNVLR